MDPLRRSVVHYKARDPFCQMNLHFCKYFLIVFELSLNEVVFDSASVPAMLRLFTVR